MVMSGSNNIDELHAHRCAALTTPLLESLQILVSRTDTSCCLLFPIPLISIGKVQDRISAYTLYTVASQAIVLQRFTTFKQK